MNEHKIKIAFVGDSGVGKTSIITRYSKGIFDSVSTSTIAAAFVRNVINVGNDTVVIQIWDTAGSERFKSLIPMYIRGSNICVVCFTDTNVEKIQEQIKYIRDIAPECIIYLAKTKTDVYHPDTDDFVEFVNENKYKVFYTSAQTGKQISEMFMDIAKTGVTISKDLMVKEKTIKLDGKSENSQAVPIQSSGCC